MSTKADLRISDVVTYGGQIVGRIEYFTGTGGILVRNERGELKLYRCELLEQEPTAASERRERENREAIRAACQLAGTVPGEPS